MPALLETKCDINYQTLSDYHFSAKEISKIRNENGQSQIVEYEFRIIFDGDDLKESQKLVHNYLKLLDKHEILEHEGNIAYLVTHLKEFEGDFINSDINLHQNLDNDISFLLKLLKLRDMQNILTMEVKHKANGKEFDEYLNINDNTLISDMINAAIDSKFLSIKENKEFLPFELQDEICAIAVPDLTILTDIKNRLLLIKEKAFNSYIIYIICKTLRDYLNNKTTLYHPTAVITNEQALIIYEICKLFGIIKLTHFITQDKINYIRSVIRNSSDKGHATFQSSD